MRSLGRSGSWGVSPDPTVKAYCVFPRPAIAGFSWTDPRERDAEKIGKWGVLWP